ncbi:MAG: hypothetical protein IJG80_01675, partial [Selenomonadaceae bacterium]|nr:hypothetical protein [Selenomonadaceae bacterium]
METSGFNQPPANPEGWFGASVENSCLTSKKFFQGNSTGKFESTIKSVSRKFLSRPPKIRQQKNFCRG